MGEDEQAYRAWRKRKPFPLKGSPKPYDGPSFVDANVFLYTQDRRDLAKNQRAPFSWRLRIPCAACPTSNAG
jgi:hypothetical protein